MTDPIDPAFHPELIAESAYLAPGAVVRGIVNVGSDSSIWFGAVVRGDTAPVSIGDRSNIQDLCVIHCDPGYPCRIGNDVTIGHAAVVHGATVEDGALIGIRAVVLNGATIGRGSLIGAGALVTEGKEIPPNCLAVGAPARVVRELTEQDRARVLHASSHYVNASRRYREEQ